MRIRRLFAANARLATRLVREELGPEAVILSNRRVEGGVEIVAATDYDESLLGNRPDPTELGEVTSASRPADRLSDVVRSDRAQQEAQSARVVWSQDPLLSGMRQELSALRELLEGQVAGLAWADYARRRPPQARLLTRLHEFGLPPELCQELLSGLAPNLDNTTVESRVLERLARTVPAIDGGVLSDGGVYALVGPTGVGKTTTVAKLAAQYTLRHGPGQVAILTTDCLRVGAFEQLRSFGRILDVPVQLVQSADELHSALQTLSDYPLVLIDTAGMSQRDVRLAEQISVLAGAAPELKVFLVLAANAQRSALLETVVAFRGVDIAGFVVTKLDETRRYGHILGVLAGAPAPLTYVSDGQRVPDDLRPAVPTELVNTGWALFDDDASPVADVTNALTFGRKVANGHV